ncbi:GNAT family N-acetyltransferase, partial [Candidatus Saccharibacteria bacterium]|nr:GNAT family N-acetyltransferase [Candidatus Saccharibacteria bacterium]
MNYKVLEEQDLAMMLDFVDDEDTKYNLEDLRKFIREDNCYGFIAKEGDRIVGFATAYTLLKPDGRKAFYLDAIDVMPEYQGKGYGTKLTEFARD